MQDIVSTAREREISRHRWRAAVGLVPLQVHVDRVSWNVKLLSYSIISITWGSPWQTFWRSLAEVHRIAAVATGPLKVFTLTEYPLCYITITSIQCRVSWHVMTQCHWSVWRLGDVMSVNARFHCLDDVCLRLPEESGKRCRNLSGSHWDWFVGLGAAWACLNSVANIQLLNIV